MSSSNLPAASSEGIANFFRTTTNRNLLVTCGGTRPCSEIKPTPEQLDDWTRRCQALGAIGTPNASDAILTVVTLGIQFPGLKVESSAVIGAKYNENGSGRFPSYEFVLLDTQQIVSGLPPAVWIFNKLTGGKGDGGNFDSLTTVSARENKENDAIVFSADALLSIDVTFPKLLLKILPGDKETIEKQGGKSVLKALDRDVTKSILAFEKAFLENMKK